MKLCNQPVDVLIGPLVEKIGVAQLREGGLHCGSVFEGTLFDTMAVIRRKAGESLLERVDVEEGDGKGSDATAGAPRVGRELHPAGRRLLAGTSGRFFDTAEQDWVELGGSFLFEGEIDDELALG
jgi:hypothetical protein